jgi:hypothetical protein
LLDPPAFSPPFAASLFSQTGNFCHAAIRMHPSSHAQNPAINRIFHNIRPDSAPSAILAQPLLSIIAP